MAPIFFLKHGDENLRFILTFKIKQLQTTLVQKGFIVICTTMLNVRKTKSSTEHNH